MTRSASSWLGQAALDPLHRVLVRVEEQPAVAASDEVQELRERELGLPPPAPSGCVGEERVLNPQTDPPLAVLILDLPERNEIDLPLERRAASLAPDTQPARAAALPVRRT